MSATSSTLEDTRTALAREGDARARLESEVSALRLDRERDLRDLRAAHSAELTAAREEGVRRAEEAAAARSVEVQYVCRVQPRFGELVCSLLRLGARFTMPFTTKGRS